MSQDDRLRESTNQDSHSTWRSVPAFRDETSMAYFVEHTTPVAESVLLAWHEQVTADSMTGRGGMLLWMDQFASSCARAAFVGSLVTSQARLLHPC